MHSTPKIALVTGAAQGIGAGIAQRLAADGCLVIVLDQTAQAGHRTVAAIEQAGGQALAVGADVANEQAVAEAVEHITSEVGAPAIVVNNAGFARDGPLAAISVQDWDEVIAVHLRGSFLLTKACLPGMKAAGWGRIVNISSISAQGHRDRANYCAAKAGMHGFIKSLAVELGPYGITANVVAPGLVVTAMTEATARRKGLTLEAHLHQAIQQIPVNRAGTPADVAHAVAFFASEAAGFITGQVLFVAGMPVD
ncbi:SDR family oxidoreductase [Hymenobacter cellulosivorans]|uniref:SDR family oxidoreductase n=1 Tax=Hymenobacter cellulosivorans TaxID=2932249 RepID=A0ABY4F8B8_9BACT|nr:SDR family NAD(P)-dependent oxidoreductase [Hymenobacter cellulosivorans]UOQ50711.1 SDR family oxidoreductase [Hymenobacter cellulosivorans]